MIGEIVFCVAGTMFFAITMRVPKSCLTYVFFGSVITCVCERTLTSRHGEIIACALAMLCLVFYGEALARTLAIPSTVIIMPSTIPLLPGSSIYYAMLYAITSNSQKFSQYAKSTLFTGLGISVGAIAASLIIKIFSEKDKNHSQNG